MDQLKVIFVGTGDLGAAILDKLAKHPLFTIPFVVTGENSQILETIKSNNLFVHKSNSIEELKQKIVQEKPDYLLVVSYGEIIDKNILKIPRCGCINIHPSLLPKYRGASPIQETLLHGDAYTGVTWIEMTEKMDSGPIIHQEKMAVDPADDRPALAKKLSVFAAEQTPEVLLEFAKKPKKFPQDEKGASYGKKISKSDGLLDPTTQTAEEMLRKIRAYKPWPGTFILWNGKRLKILSAHRIDQKISSGEMKAENNELLLGTLNGTLAPIVVQLEGKKEMMVGEFLKGQREIPGKLN